MEKKNEELKEENLEAEIEKEDTAIDTETEETIEDGVEKGEVKEDLEKKEDDKKDDTLERLMRTMAEFDNYRKRTEKEKVQRYEVGVKYVLEKILPVIDNFERALSALTEEEKESSFAQGVEKIYKQFITILKEMDVEAIEAVGKTFDPNYHNAVMHIEDDDSEENMVVEEFQKGYMYKDTVLRYSMVKVAN